MHRRRTSRSANIVRMCRPVAETLENRRLLATLYLTPSTVPYALVGRNYSVNIEGYGPDATSAGPYTYTLDPTSVDGLASSVQGNVLTLSGVPTTAGSFSFSVGVTDAGGDTGSNTFTLTVCPPSVPGINLCLDDAGSPLAGAAAGVPYSAVLNAAGGNGDYTYKLPASVDGLTVFPYADTVTISGTPALAGTFSFAISTSDSAGNTGVQSFALDVGLGLVPGMLPSPGNLLAPGLVNQPYRQAITAMGGTGSLSYASYPATLDGLNLSVQGGALVLLGKPETAGPYSFSVTAKDRREPRSQRELYARRRQRARDAGDHDPHGRNNDQPEFARPGRGRSILLARARVHGGQRGIYCGAVGTPASQGLRVVFQPSGRHAHRVWHADAGGDVWIYPLGHRRLWAEQYDATIHAHGRCRFV